MPRRVWFIPAILAGAAICLAMVITAMPVWAQQLPDLIIARVWVSGSQVCYSLKNQGQVPAGSLVARITIYSALQVDGQMVDDDAVGGPLAPSQQVDRCFDYQLPRDGRLHQLRVCADSRQAIRESNENNNCSELTWRSPIISPGITPIPVLPSTATPTATAPPAAAPSPALLPSATPAPFIPPVGPAPPVPPPAPVSPVDRFAGVIEGPVMPGAFDDGDGDGVLNLLDRCPNTPASKRHLVYENGCLCRDTDGGVDIYRRGTVTFRLDDGREETRQDSCDGNRLTEYSCNPRYEETGMGAAFIATTADCTTACGRECSCHRGQCYPVVEAIPNLCWFGEATCADGVQNGRETGVDCGGICPPCNTRCTTGTKYAPSDTPCTTHYPTDMHRVDWSWTDNELEYVCQFNEVCHPELDHVITEATRCCSIPTTRSGLTSEESEAALERDIGALPSPGLCREARVLAGRSGGCRKCVGLYIIKGLGNYARWMVGYNWLYPEHNVYGAVDQQPAEALVNDFRTGVCRDYSMALTTLLRKAGYSQEEASGFCDGGHCYNVVKLPGDTRWHVVDTTGNAIGIVLGSLPGGHPYCAKLSEATYCYGGIRTTGEPCTGTEPVSVDFGPLCGPGLACTRDIFTAPGWATLSTNIIGCGP